MRRIATIGAVITAFAVAPSLAVAAEKPAQAKPQLTAQVIGVQVARVQRAQVAALSVQRHRAHMASAYRIALIRAQLR